ncbi:NAD-dependent epimerase/dehydratase family protein [Bradyrhizobium sp. HKCCYLS20291]|uniref:NAD-dependent epimerase/dehydratase family protein n=1 Tax=Bradyrhizobium sp. HKCCYLS20291 TaxID=3420766 RepID=UPI003EB9B592
MDRKINRPESIVIGGSGLVGTYLLDHLVARGERPLNVGRSEHGRADVDHLGGDMNDPESLRLPAAGTLYCATHATSLAPALPHLLAAGADRVVVLSSTSVLTKKDSEIASERAGWHSLINAEQSIIQTCERLGVGWTILRPTLIYCEGQDRNVTPLARLIRRFRVMPLVGGGTGLRQPIHAGDLAAGMMAAAATPAAANRTYAVGGGETVTYREMIGRIFDGLGLHRRMPSVPGAVWRRLFPLIAPLYPEANVAMGLRMTQDMAFDATPAIRDFGWAARDFRPRFDQSMNTTVLRPLRMTRSSR